MTPGTSVVNDTINYTTHPSVNADWTRIPNATLSVPLEHTLDTFRTHRFDCDHSGSRYFLDDHMVHEDHRGGPREGGSLQLKLWADGNKWWSGIPSRTDTFLHIRKLEAYFNVTTQEDRSCDKPCLQKGPVSPIESTSMSSYPTYSGTSLPLSTSPNSAGLPQLRASGINMVMGCVVAVLGLTM